MYNYTIHIVNQHCLDETTLNIEAIVRVYIPIPTSQLALFVRDNC